MWRDLGRALTDLVLPAPCAGCGRESVTDACAGCLSSLVRPRRVPAPAPGLPPVLHLAEWTGAARELVLAHKERGRTGLARPLGTALAAAVLAAPTVAPGRPVVLVPVPSRPQMRRRRGHDPVARMTRAAAAELRRRGHRARSRALLRHARAVRDQAGLTAAQRARNLGGALVARRSSTVRRGADLVLVDDILTTGATLAEAARALRASGRPPVAAVVVAAVARRPL